MNLLEQKKIRRHWNQVDLIWDPGTEKMQILKPSPEMVL